MNDSTKKWLWGAAGLAAGAGLAWLLFGKKKPAPQALPTYPEQVPVQSDASVAMTGIPPGTLGAQSDGLKISEPGQVPGGEPSQESYDSNGEF